MPELPEVESVRRGLVTHTVGQQIVSAEPFGARVSRRSVRELSSIAGATVAGVARRGKFLWFDLEPGGSGGLGDSGDSVGSGIEGIAAREPRSGAGHSALVAHLGMSGQFRVDCDGLAHVRARLIFGDGSHLEFIDQRTFGYLAPDDYEETDDDAPGGLGIDRPVVPHLAAHIARDLLDPGLDRVALAVTMASKRTAIKKLLLDQSVVSGIGNIYADEALYDARIHPFRPANSLSGPEMSRLLVAATQVLERSLAAGGTSFDSLYVQVNGESGYFERSLRAYGRGGMPCQRCGTELLKVMSGGRSSTFCPRCQGLRSCRERNGEQSSR